jgi:hypothetical protein
MVQFIACIAFRFAPRWALQRSFEVVDGLFEFLEVEFVGWCFCCRCGRRWGRGWWWRWQSCQMELRSFLQRTSELIVRREILRLRLWVSKEELSRRPMKNLLKLCPKQHWNRPIRRPASLPWTCADASELPPTIGRHQWRRCVSMRHWLSNSHNIEQSPSPGDNRTDNTSTFHSPSLCVWGNVNCCCCCYYWNAVDRPMTSLGRYKCWSLPSKS